MSDAEIVLVVFTIDKTARRRGESPAVIGKLDRPAHTIVAFEIGKDRGHPRILHARKPVEVRAELNFDAIVDYLKVL